MTRTAALWMLIAIAAPSACGSNDRDAPAVDAGAIGDAPAGDGPPAPLHLTLVTMPTVRAQFAAEVLLVPLTATNTGPVPIPITLSNFYVKVDGSVLIPAVPTGRHDVPGCLPAFILLPGGSLTCTAGFVINVGTASEVRYDDGSSAPPVSALTRRPEIAGCVAEELRGTCFESRSLQNLHDLLQRNPLACISDYIACRARCLDDTNISDCTCYAECPGRDTCFGIQDALTSAITTCAPPH